VDDNVVRRCWVRRWVQGYDRVSVRETVEGAVGDRRDDRKCVPHAPPRTSNSGDVRGGVDLSIEHDPLDVYQRMVIGCPVFRFCMIIKSG